MLIFEIKYKLLAHSLIALRVVLNCSLLGTRLSISSVFLSPLRLLTHVLSISVNTSLLLRSKLSFIEVLSVCANKISSCEIIVIRNLITKRFIPKKSLILLLHCNKLSKWKKKCYFFCKIFRLLNLKTKKNLKTL